ncbi:hypothetical protein EKE94_06480 [Mesobaculum littorinae]|uniref:Tat pathway signal sequence domain protein n=1 Tax=Mesobaculum littorinae TaxID=2486419 RepID=A0A438AIX6_9RHOB|nr:hypothetical protein [Mesobaculum littorinae]RVV98557.1 hypothetical protein EKE94_06480 [Mesobaculum littorinae]
MQARLIPATLTLLAATVSVAAAQETAADADPAMQAADATPALSVELNAMTPTEGACRLTFLVENRLGADLDKAVFETVLLTDEGIVDRLTLFDFRDLPQDRRRVRQFDLPNLDCGGLGQVLFNAADSCDGAGIAPGACMDALDLSSRTDVEMAG